MSTPTAPDGVTADAGTAVARVGDAGARIADELRRRILDGSIAPGERIRQEEIAARVGASRVPVREAIKILEADGLVRVVANSGAWVARLTLDECHEIYQMRERLEPLLLAYSMPLLDADGIAHLADLAAQMEGGSEQEEFLRLDREFHLASYAPARTLQLGELVRRLWDTTQPYRRAYTTALGVDATRTIHDEHHLLVVALRAGDLEGAQHVLAGHIRRTRRHLSHHPELFET